MKTSPNKLNDPVPPITYVTHLNQIKDALIKTLKLLIRKETIIEVICALTIILFIYTGLNKIMDLNKFKSTIDRSPFIQNYSSFLTYFIPIGEIFISVLLIIPRSRLLGLYLSFALMAFFTGYVWLMLNYAYDLPCSCGGIISELTWEDHLVFNSIYTLLPFTGILLQSTITRQKKK